MSDILSNIVNGGRQAFRTVASVVAGTEESRKRTASYTPSPDEQRALDLLVQPKLVRQRTLEIFEPIWTKCLLYTAGLQHLRYMVAQRQFDRVRVEDHIPLPVENLIQPKVQRVVDFFTSKRPIMNAEPRRRTSEDDRNAARLGTAVLEDIWERRHVEVKLDELMTWVVTIGNGFMKQFVDTRRRMAAPVPRYQMQKEPFLVDGQPVINPETGMPILTTRYVEERDEAGMPVVDEFVQPEIGCEVPNTIGMTVPLATPPGDLDESPWILETGIYSMERLRELFPDKADFLPVQGKAVSADIYVYRISSLMASGLGAVTRSLDPTILEGFGVVHTLEMLPNRDYPNGLHMIEFNNIPLYIGEVPLKTRYSYQHYGYYRVPGRFWCRGMVEDLIGPQDSVNKMEQFQQANDNMNANPVWLVPDQAGLTQGTISNAPGTNITYTYPFEPKREPGMSLPAAMIQRKAMYIEAAEEISGVRHVIQGDAPTGVTAGVALNRLGEEAESMWGPIMKRFERSLERTGASILGFVEKYYTLPRYFALAGDDGDLTEIEDFVGAMLRGNTEVKVEAGSYRPRSRAGEMQVMFDLAGQGLLPDLLFDPDKHARFLELVGAKGFEMTGSLDFRRAQWENEMMARDVGWEQVARMAGDDDLVHLQTHTNYRKTPTYRRLPNSVQQRFLMHEIEHLEALQETGGQPIVTGGEDAAMGAGPEGEGPEGGSQAGEDGANDGQTSTETE